MYNILEVEDKIKGFPDEALVKEAQFSLVLQLRHAKPPPAPSQPPQHNSASLFVHFRP